MRNTFLNSQFQLLHFKCFDLFIQNWLSLFDQATCVTKLIVFCSRFVLIFFSFFFIPLCKGERSEEKTYLNTELNRIFLT